MKKRWGCCVALALAFCVWLPGGQAEQVKNIGLPPNVAGGLWAPAYMNFLVTGAYLQTEEYYADVEDDYLPIAYCLYDMDADAVPELLIYNGSDAHAANGTHVYRMNGTVQYAGTIWGGPEADDPIWVSADRNYPGVFLTNGGMGFFDVTYFTMLEGVLSEELVGTLEYVPDGDDYASARTRVTESEGLYAASQQAESLPSLALGEMLQVLTAGTAD